jgi:putative FmdB family regulatory protein
MPTYEFRCPLGHEFEKFYRSIGTAESQAVCPQCGQPAERMMSAAGFAFKGSGFYLTDYGKNAHRERGAVEAKDKDSGDGAKGESKGESAKSDGASKPAESSGGSSADSAKGNGKGDAKKAESKPAESKPAAAPPKSSSGE